MNISGTVAAVTAVLVVCACADWRDMPGPTAPAFSIQDQVTATAARRVQVSGSFGALVDFSTLVLTPRGGNCLLEVEGRLVFTGTIVGVAAGTTSALVFATCEQVLSTPPGTYRDVFKSDLTFEGTVDGEPARAKVLYQGGVEPGGQIDAHIIFSMGVAGVLDAEAIVAVGGEYRGSVVVK